MQTLLHPQLKETLIIIDNTLRCTADCFALMNGNKNKQFFYAKFYDNTTLMNARLLEQLYGKIGLVHLGTERGRLFPLQDKVN